MCGVHSSIKIRRPFFFLLLISIPILSRPVLTRLEPGEIQSYDLFGYSLAFDGDRIVVGAVTAEGVAERTGAAYVFHRSDRGWTEEARILAEDGESRDQFGQAVALYQDRMAVGAPMHDAAGEDAGAVYVYLHDGTDWSLENKLTAGEDAVVRGRFGLSIGMSNDWLLVGAPGAGEGKVYGYRLQDGLWRLVMTLLPDPNEQCDDFGAPLSLDPFNLLVGSRRFGDEKAGLVFTYSRFLSVWSAGNTLLPVQFLPAVYYGQSIDLYEGVYAIVGAYGESFDGVPDTEAGSAFVYEMGNQSWTLAQKLIPSDRNRNDQFGRAVAITETMAAVGAPGDDDVMKNAGAFYLYPRGVDAWDEMLKIPNPEPLEYDAFAQHLTMKDRTLVVGSEYDNPDGPNSGSVYVYEINSNPDFYSASDVPHDQGGFVYLQWHASIWDLGGRISHYSVWRALPDGPNSLQKGSGVMRRTASRAWEWIAEQPAHGFDRYAYTASTLYDSLSVTDGMHEFLISAHRSDLDVFYDSDPVSGYSVDNLPPYAPENLTASQSDAGVRLRWDASGESDFSHYQIVRNGAPLATTITPEYVDPTISTDVAVHYQVRAVDVHENAGPLSDPVEVQWTGVGDVDSIPAEYRLEQNFPNPFNPETEISYQLSAFSRVRLEVVDVTGRTVSVLADGEQAAGWHRVMFDGSSLPSGIYFYRLQAGAFSKIRKMVLLE